LIIDQNGALLGKKFYRGLMRSAARLTYEIVQETADSNGELGATVLWDSRLKPLYSLYHKLKKRREKRGALGIESQEFQIKLDDDHKQIMDIHPRERLDSHQLIEEMMILANVAAAEVLEAKNALCMYRIHEPPDNTKIEGLRTMLDSLDIKLPRGRLAPEHFNRVLQQVSTSPHKHLVHESVLRCQSAAFYGPKNRGHFGLALDSYGHFTSPIRRYADLVVHRLLVHHLKLGEGGHHYDNMAELSEIGERISLTERRSVEAERGAKDRYAAAFYANRISEKVEGRVSSVTKFGLFIKLSATGADGLLPFSALPDDRYEISDNEHFVKGRRWGKSFARGDIITVKIVEADPILSSLTFEFVDTITAVPRKDKIKTGHRKKPRSSGHANRRRR
jgi:ribonuclease R